MKPVVAVTATKTGAGKSTASRVLLQKFLKRKLESSVVRHPMVYGDIKHSTIQIFKELNDLYKHGLTVEEIEEYEPHIELDATVLAGTDYARILVEAEKLRDIVLWDGGNNDWPFYRPWYWITVTDATRPGIEVESYPGELNNRTG